ncbi:unnamed protein product [Gongylonema pulchrum]|uniref:ATP_bind_3 domain-containing protein n=1 Tax=Gongylonema pulchrum TaxID=637853 RepID=A0A183EII9_9BILA|nr:unnamed protein product [Gongylonema pulchrum]
MPKCWKCDSTASVKRSSDGNPACVTCFTEAFESEVHDVIVRENLFRSGKKIAIGASGGKDSTVLACVLNKLNKKHGYGLDIVLVSIDEGIEGYRDDSLEVVESNKIDYDMPLRILNYKDLYGWTMDDVVKKIGTKNNCTFCGEIHDVIVREDLFRSGKKIAIGASGGKDSTVLACVLNKLNKKHGYGLDIVLVSIDEGIEGYRDDSLEVVESNKIDYGMPLRILNYKDLYGWTMDDVVKKIGTKNNCTFCGVFRRRALDRGAALCGADMIATGHNADDMAETVLLNVLRGDIARLQRCAAGSMPRVKPLKYTFEKDIVLYAHFNKLRYFSTECRYARDSFRSYIRTYVKELERIRPKAILDLIRSGESIHACLLLQGLNTNNHKLGVNSVSFSFFY